MPNRLYRALLSVLLLTMLAFSVHAEQKVTLGDWDVHYMVVGTTFLTPQVANANDIVRSRYNALINISVLDADTQKAQDIAITGSATNLLGTKKNLSFKQVREGEAIYYLAQLNFRDRETYRFNVVIQQGNQSQTLKFQQELFVD
ncbi:DUF4426 domain-containing protein [Alteromonas oceanisediminis]|uniref:DUF4426 domain-containing protein n=1 Tax=Alteromonas oceanisediminis TaxID=2836180 RepID=UPI001BD99694|nr:DUF4426 domain-containing protein [Alteromonas oceanisediminis]MBT0585489.1 DUF4426 domain-containing protein [Alteromonas oceanisediminis]